MIDGRFLLVLIGAAALLAAGLAARAWWSARGPAGSTLVSVDTSSAGTRLRSDRWGLVGRPDELRRLPDDRLVPVEVKSRARPGRGIPDSHRLQVYAYLALLDDQPGGAAPFGILRYGDGGEVRLPWDAAARSELSRTIAEARRPYDGRARPGPGRCPRCPWFEGCDARWTG